jgi:hypothetical protein
MAFERLVGTRILLAVPIALCLALLIILEDPFQRALTVVALVLLEILRDALSISAAASSAVDAVREARMKRSRGRRK